MLMIGGPNNGQVCKYDVNKVIVPDFKSKAPGIGQLFYYRRYVKIGDYMHVECFVFEDLDDAVASSILEFHINATKQSTISS
jgi:hypothetical protein